MRKEIEVRTTVEVDLSMFCITDLIEELEYRGHSVDDKSDLSEYSLEDVADDLEQRKYYGNFQFTCHPDGFIKALKLLDCPRDIIEQLEDWAKTPVVNNARLSKWLEMAVEHSY